MKIISKLYTYLWVTESMTTPTRIGGRHRPQLSRVNELKTCGRSQSLDESQTTILTKPLIFGGEMIVVRHQQNCVSRPLS